MSRYGVVPMWNSGKNCWEAVDFQRGQRVVEWPDGIDPLRLPLPEYNEGDHVQFVRDETCAREGVVRCVLFQGDLARRDAGDIVYIVTARGHDHRIRAWNILGRFVGKGCGLRLYR